MNEAVSAHIGTISTKANRTLGLLSEIGSTAVKATAYKAFVHLLLEYALVWDPTQQGM